MTRNTADAWREDESDIRAVLSGARRLTDEELKVIAGSGAAVLQVVIRRQFSPPITAQETQRVMMAAMALELLDTRQ